jgi:hypothetical protein
VLLNLLLLVGAAPYAEASRGPAGETVHIAVTGTDEGLWSTPGNNIGFTGLGGIGLYTPAVGLLQTSATGFDPLYITVGEDESLWARTSGAGFRHLSTNHTLCVDQPGLYTEGAQDSSGWFTRVWAACVGEDGSVWFASGTTRGNAVPVLNNWTSLGGVAVHGVAVARVAGAITFVVNGTDGDPVGTSVYTRTITNGWTKTTWGCVGTPALGSAYGKAWFGCQGLNQALWYARNFGSGWTGAQSAGGVLDGPPGVAVTFSGATFEVRGTNSAIWENFVPNSGQPGGFSSTGGVVPEDFGVAAVGTTPIVNQ